LQQQSPFKTNEAILRWSHIGLSLFGGTLEVSKISSWFSCPRSFSETLFRFDEFGVSTLGESLVAENISVFSSREFVGRSAKSTEGISSVERDDAWAFDFLKKIQ
jgi:hypothetical protein